MNSESSQFQCVSSESAQSFIRNKICALLDQEILSRHGPAGARAYAGPRTFSNLNHGLAG